METPFISIIIPVFNASDYLDKCLDSISKQNFKSFEILIIHRIINEETIDVIARKHDDLPIKIIKTQKAGIYKAMNIGCENAAGKWFIFLGQDDQLANSDTFSNVFKSLKNSHGGIALGGVEIIEKKSWLVPSFYANRVTPLIFVKNTLHHQGIIYHSSIFNKIKYDEDLNVLADYKLNLELIKKKTNVIRLNFLISKCNGTGISKKFTKSLYAEERKIKKSLFHPVLYFILAFFITIKQLIKTSLSN